VLEVDDDGCGFDPATVTGPGQGLGNLQQRAQRLGGRVEIHTSPGQGTRIRIEIPPDQASIFRPSRWQVKDTEHHRSLVEATVDRWSRRVAHAGRADGP
jgi:hypothetical protein